MDTITERRTLWERRDDESGARLVAVGNLTLLSTNLARPMGRDDLLALADACRWRARELAEAEAGMEPATA